MDGRNGYYRVGYPTTPDGYGPYELSGSSLLFGFWSLLPSKEIHQVYSFLYKNFDSFDNEKELYKKAFFTQRERNEIYVNAFENRLIRYIVLCASEIEEEKETLYGASSS